MFEIYPPAEDSYLLSRILEKQLPNLIEKNPYLKFLEIGTGSGIHLQTALTLGIKKENIFSSDINQKSVDYCNLIGFKSIQSNLFNKIPKNKKFNLIIFNPPYLPEDKYDKEVDTTGGKFGSEIINKFLKQASSYLTDNGKVILLTSSLTKDINWQSYEKRLLGKKKLFYEELFVWEFKQ